MTDSRAFRDVLRRNRYRRTPWNTSICSTRRREGTDFPDLAATNRHAAVDSGACRYPSSFIRLRAAASRDSNAALRTKREVGGGSVLGPSRGTMPKWR